MLLLYVYLVQQQYVLEWMTDTSHTDRDKNKSKKTARTVACVCMERSINVFEKISFCTNKYFDVAMRIALSSGISLVCK